jgi:hypothetical protein
MSLADHRFFGRKCKPRSIGAESTLRTSRKRAMRGRGKKAHTEVEELLLLIPVVGSAVDVSLAVKNGTFGSVYGREWE